MKNKKLKTIAVYLLSALAVSQLTIANASQGEIKFSGSLVNPTCQLTSNNQVNSVNISQCGNEPHNFQNTINLSNNKKMVGNGIAEVSYSNMNVGTIINVTYN